MAVDIVFETHATSEDNEAGRATGWLPGRLSAAGREQAAALGARRMRPPPAAVFASALRRAVETVQIAFAGRDVGVFLDWRLRECNFGALNGHDAATMHDRRARFVDSPYPGGESWRDAVRRTGRCLDDLRRDWSGRQVLVVGHIATRWALEHMATGVRVEDLVGAEFVWQPGWRYRLG